LGQANHEEKKERRKEREKKEKRNAQIKKKIAKRLVEKRRTCGLQKLLCKRKISNTHPGRVTVITQQWNMRKNHQK